MLVADVRIFRLVTLRDVLEAEVLIRKYRPFDQDLLAVCMFRDEALYAPAGQVQN